MTGDVKVGSCFRGEKHIKACPTAKSWYLLGGVQNFRRAPPPLPPPRVLFSWEFPRSLVLFLQK